MGKILWCLTLFFASCGCSHGEDIRVRVRDRQPVFPRIGRPVYMVPAVMSTVPTVPAVVVKPEGVAGTGILPTLTANEKATQAAPASPPRTRVLIERN